MKKEGGGEGKMRTHEGIMLGAHKGFSLCPFAVGAGRAIVDRLRAAQSVSKP